MKCVKTRDALFTLTAIVPVADIFLIFQRRDVSGYTIYRLRFQLHEI